MPRRIDGNRRGLSEAKGFGWPLSLLWKYSQVLGTGYIDKI